jgi:iron(III) transport system permease protein
MRTMNPALEEASSASGARPLTTFFRVTLPVLRPGVLAPLILATLVALEQFEMPLIIGFPARINVFSTRLYFDLNPEDELPAYGKAAAVALLFLVAAVVLLVIYNHLIRRAERFVTVTGKGYRLPRSCPRSCWSGRASRVAAMTAWVSTPTGSCSPIGVSGRQCATPSWSPA